MLSSLAPARRRMVLGALAVLGVLIVVVASLAFVDSRGPKVSSQRSASVAPGEAGPVVLVPGYGGSTSALDVLATALRRIGRTTEVVHLPDNATGDLRQQAATVGDVVEQLRADGAATIDLVGYSAGGVVARLWLRYDGGAAITRRVVTLGTPHHGTDLAALAGSLLPAECPTACRQLEPGSALLDALNRPSETLPGPSYVSIWTTHDTVVEPPSSARLNGALNMTVQSVCPQSTVDHGNLPRDRSVESMVIDELGTNPPGRLTRRDCVTT